MEKGHLPTARIVSAIAVILGCGKLEERSQGIDKMREIKQKLTMRKSASSLMVNWHEAWSGRL